MQVGLQHNRRKQLEMEYDNALREARYVYEAHEAELQNLDKKKRREKEEKL